MEKKKKKVRVFGHVDTVVSTVIEIDDDFTPEEIYEAASSSFQGISQLVGNGGCGEKMVGVNGPDDTIMVDEAPTFDDYTDDL